MCLIMIAKVMASIQRKRTSGGGGGQAKKAKASDAGQVPADVRQQPHFMQLESWLNEQIEQYASLDGCLTEKLKNKDRH